MKLRSIFVSDDSAICLSALCVLHCLMCVVFVVLLPALALNELVEHIEVRHQIMLAVFVPISLIMVWQGRKQHQRSLPAVLAVPGMLILIAVSLLEGTIESEVLLLAISTLGGGLSIAGHYLNRQYIRACQTCPAEQA